MVLVILNQQHRLSETWQNQVNDQLPIRLTFYGKGHITRLRCIKLAVSIPAPHSLVTRCGPNKRSGRFQRIQAEANLPHIPGPDSAETHDPISRPNAPVFKLGWPLLLSIALACFLFRRFTSPCRSQGLQQLTPGQAAVAMVSETPHPSTPLQRPGVWGQQHQQQQAFASISAAGFARLFSGAQRAHLAQLLVYQAQRVSCLLSKTFAFGVDRRSTPPSHIQPPLNLSVTPISSSTHPTQPEPTLPYRPCLFSIPTSPQRLHFTSPSLLFSTPILILILAWHP